MTDQAIPQIVAELIEVAGADAAWALVRAWGGRNVYIPPQLSDGHWLVELVGQAAAEAICRHFRQPTADGSNLGRRLLIPKAGGPSQLDAARDAAWAEALAADLSLRETAGLLGVTERAVSYRKAKKSDDRQGKLFE